jgi:hypothetical protein
VKQTLSSGHLSEWILSGAAKAVLDKEIYTPPDDSNRRYRVAREREIGCGSDPVVTVGEVTRAVRADIPQYR